MSRFEGQIIWSRKLDVLKEEMSLDKGPTVSPDYLTRNIPQPQVPLLTYTKQQGVTCRTGSSTLPIASKTWGASVFAVGY